MIKNKKKTLTRLITTFFVLVMAFGLKSNANAAGEYATLSGGGSVNMGATVKVSLNLSSSSGLGSVTGALSYNKDVLKFSSCSGATVNGGGGSVSYSEAFNGEKSKSVVFTFTTVGQGTGTVNLTECIIADFDTAAEVNCAGGKATFTVGAAQAGESGGNNNTTTEKKGNSKLSALTISPGELSPAFAAGTFTYTAEVPEGTTQITVSATPQDKTSKVKSVNGAKSIEHGENTVTVIVEASDGSRSTYKIMVYCGVKVPGSEPDTGGAVEVDCSFNGNAYTVLNTIPESEIPSGFTLTTTQFNGNTVRAVKNEALGLTLCYLNNRSNDSKSFFVLSEGALFPFVKATLSGESYVILLQPDPAVSFPRVFINATSEILGVQFECLKHDGSVEGEALFVYGMNEKGEKGWYRYDTVLKTLQRFDLEAMGKYEDGLVQSKDAADKFKLWFIIAAAAAGVLLIVTIVFAVVLGKKSKENHGQKTIDNIMANEVNELQKAEKRTEPKPIAKAGDKPLEPKNVTEPEMKVEEAAEEAQLDFDEVVVDTEEVQVEESVVATEVETSKVEEKPQQYVPNDDDYKNAVVEDDDDYNTAVVEDDDDYKRVSGRQAEEVHYETEFEFIDFDD